VFLVPDDVYVRTVSELYESTEYYNDTATYINALNLKVGLNIKGQPKDGGSSSKIFFFLSSHSKSMT
jgi:hypothetical protein